MHKQWQGDPQIKTNAQCCGVVIFVFFRHSELAHTSATMTIGKLINIETLVSSSLINYHDQTYNDDLLQPYLCFPDDIVQIDRSHPVVFLETLQVQITGFPARRLWCVTPPSTTLKLESKAKKKRHASLFYLPCRISLISCEIRFRSRALIFYCNLEAG